MDIFVAKLNAQTTSDNLKELFEQFGNVVSSKVIMDRETGMSKCYGFVEMDDVNDVKAAVEQLNGAEFMGNTIVVKESEPRPQQDRRSSDRRQDFGGGFRRPDNNGGNRRFDRGGNSGGRGGYGNGGNRGGGDYNRRDRRDSRGGNDHGGYNRYE